MSGKVKVPLFQAPLRCTTLEQGATVGAIFGVNLRWPDGTLVTAEDFAPEPDDSGNGLARTLWRLVLEIPPNVTALENATGTGLFAVTGDGTGAMRSLADSATIEWTNRSGVSGDPSANLKALPDTGIGAALVKTTRDAYGRVEGSEAATTDDLPEGVANLYFTLARALSSLSLDPTSEPELITNFDTVAKTRFFRADNTAIGAPPTSLPYTGVGLQIGRLSQRTQIFAKNYRGIVTRSDDGSGWSPWLSFSLSNSAVSSGPVLPLVTGEIVDEQPVFVYADDGSLIYVEVD